MTYMSAGLCCFYSAAEPGHSHSVRASLTVLSAQRNHPHVAMAVRGCVTLLFILLSGMYDCVVAGFISDGVTLQKQILSLFLGGYRRPTGAREPVSISISVNSYLRQLEAR